MHNTRLPYRFLSILLLMFDPMFPIAAEIAPAPATTPTVAPATLPTEADAVDVLRDVMRREERFVKVHAAEALIELGLPAGIRDVFTVQEREHREVPMYRLGVWRTLARCTAGTPEYAQWVDKIRKVAFDAAAPDRIGGIESLAKLKYTLAPGERPEIERLAAGDDEGIALFSIWLLFQTPGSANPQDRVARYLDAKDPVTRLRAMYILRFLPELSIDNRTKLKAAARAEAKGTLTHAYGTSSSFIVARVYNADGDGDEAERARAELHRVLKTGQPAAKQEACRALGEQGSHDDLDAIAPLLTDPASPARVGAGLATARIARLRTGGPASRRVAGRPALDRHVLPNAGSVVVRSSPREH